MLDRVSLSIENNWIDRSGNVYIYFTLNEIRQNLGCGAEKAVALLSELDSKKGIGLIERRKQGQGKPTMIYVKNFVADCPGQTSDNQKSEPIQTSEKPKSQPAQTSENQKSALLENRSQDFGKSDTIKTDNIKTDFIKTNPSINQSDRCDGWNGSITEFEQLEQVVAEQIYLDAFLDERGEDGQLTYRPELIRAVLIVMVELLAHTGDAIFVDGGNVSAELVKKRVLDMRPSDFEYVLKGLHNNTNSIRNMKAYIRTAVYRATTMSDAHFDYDENGGYGVGVPFCESDVQRIVEYGKRMRERFDRLRSDDKGG